MGLDIKTYHYSYRTLHLLRQLALRYESVDIRIHDFYDQYPEVKTKFNEFIYHSDCEGFYISKSSKQYNKIKKKIQNRYGQLFCYFGDLDKLKKELNELNSYMLQNSEGLLKEAWIDFYNDVMSARKILEFH